MHPEIIWVIEIISGICDKNSSYLSASLQEATRRRDLGGFARKYLENKNRCPTQVGPTRSFTIPRNEKTLLGRSDLDCTERATAVPI